MLNLLNSPLDDSPDIIELSYDSPMASGVENSSPSSVGSLFKDSLDVLQQSETEIWDKAPQAEFQWFYYLFKAYIVKILLDVNLVSVPCLHTCLCVQHLHLLT